MIIITKNINKLLIYPKKSLYTNIYCKTGLRETRENKCALCPFSSPPSPLAPYFLKVSVWEINDHSGSRGWQPTQRWYWIDFRNVAEVTVWCIPRDMNHKTSIKKPLNGWHQKYYLWWLIWLSHYNGSQVGSSQTKLLFIPPRWISPAIFPFFCAEPWSDWTHCVSAAAAECRGSDARRHYRSLNTEVFVPEMRRRTLERKLHPIG